MAKFIRVKSELFQELIKAHPKWKDLETKRLQVKTLELEIEALEAELGIEPDGDEKASEADVEDPAATEADKPVILEFIKKIGKSDAMVARGIDKALKGKLKGKAKYALAALVSDAKVKTAKLGKSPLPAYYGSLK